MFMGFLDGLRTPVPVVLYALFLIDDTEVKIGGSSAWFFIAGGYWVCGYLGLGASW
ncbi:hypothetical protein HRbin02_00177 [Candidatus Calditenuaceae archaeon HR02]|nr:hypothetical protein HRbin02_00177 [Candidatus Calditenuaceae archaeon HR02]